ncbi:hypothetical protein TNCV_4392821 [Trichonephila clavipes]|nr:hypothetical protein TNCV_4392821 [Trichonephila clavipes]
MKITLSLATSQNAAANSVHATTQTVNLQPQSNPSRLYDMGLRTAASVQMPKHRLPSRLQKEINSLTRILLGGLDRGNIACLAYTFPDLYPLIFLLGSTLITCV